MAQRKKQSFNKAAARRAVAARLREQKEKFANAIGRGHVKKVESILNKHPDAVSWPIDSYYNTELKISPLLHALYDCEAHEGDIVKLLLRKGANANDRAPFEYSSKTALMIAIQRGASISVVKALIQSGAQVDAKETSGNTALIHAVDDRRTDIAKLLLDKGADVNVRSDDDETPLTIALRNSDPELVSLLLSHGADVHAPDKRGVSIASSTMERDEYKITKLIERAIEDHEKKEQEKKRQKAHEEISSSIHNGLPHDIVVVPLRLKNSPKPPDPS